MESVAFDLHTLELLQFPKIREMAASYCFTSLGKERASQMNRVDSFDVLRDEILLVTEMVKSLSLGQTPPFAGLSDIRLLVRRASIGSQLTAEQLLQVSDALVCTGHMYRYRMRLHETLMTLSELLAPVEDFSLTAKMIQGCIDPRGQVLDMASPELGAVRLKISVIEEAIQVQIRKIISDPGVPHKTLGEEPAAVVHLKPGGTAGEAELRQWVRERLAAFKVPVEVRFWPEPLPRNANGKILKTELKSVFEART